jgi:hypothetical protein
MSPIYLRTNTESLVFRYFLMKCLLDRGRSCHLHCCRRAWLVLIQVYTMNWFVITILVYTHTQLRRIHSYHYSENLLMMCWINKRRTVYSANDTALTHLPLFLQLSMRETKEFEWCQDAFTRNTSTVCQSTTFTLCSWSMSINMNQFVSHDSSI